MAASEKVFVVHGRNLAARDSMFAFLRALGLRPIEWDQAIALTGKGSPYIGETLDAAFEEGQAIVVLLTPDDIAYLRMDYASGDGDPEMEPRGQARPNVLFEAGMAFGRSSKRTILVESGELRPFSDVSGRHALRMAETSEFRKSLAERLMTAGCRVDMTGSDWLRSGDFNPPPKPGGDLPVGKRVPSQDRFGPHVDGRWFKGSGNKADVIKLTNNGATPLLKIRLVVPEPLSGHIHLHDNEPVAKLPIGKSITIRAGSAHGTLGGGGPRQFELTAVGELESGAEFIQDVYFDAG